MVYELAMTQGIAMSAGLDAGNRSMRAAGRTKWNADDRAAAQAEFDRLFTVEAHLSRIAALEVVLHHITARLSAIEAQLEQK